MTTSVGSVQDPANGLQWQDEADQENAVANTATSSSAGYLK